VDHQLPVALAVSVQREEIVVVQEPAVLVLVAQQVHLLEALSLMAAAAAAGHTQML
jgi:hypothetical protein